MSGKRDDRVLADGGRNQGSGQGDARQGGGAHQGTASQQGTGSRHGGPAAQGAGSTQGGGGQAGGHGRQAGGQGGQAGGHGGQAGGHGGQAGGHARQGGRSPRGGGTGSPPGGGGGHAGGYGYGGPSPIARYAKIGLGVHLLFALGSALTIMLFSTFAPGGTATTTLPLGSGLGTGNLMASMLMAFGFAVVLGPLVAIGVGVYAGYDAHPGTSPPVLGAAANVVGAGVTLLVTILLVVVLAQRGSAQGLGQLFGPMLGAVIGIGVVGAGAGFLGSRLRS